MFPLSAGRTLSWNPLILQFSSDNLVKYSLRNGKYLKVAAMKTLKSNNHLVDYSVSTFNMLS
jgi:hypothetical protein